MTRPLTAVLIVAAGRGTRAAANGAVAKQYRRLSGETVLARSIAAFASHPGVDLIQVVIHEEDLASYEAATARFAGRLRPPVLGGATRQDSVRAGLSALGDASPAWVLIHDAARPLVSRGVIDRVLAALSNSPGALAALPVSDTLKRAGADGHVAATVERGGLWRAQTPQGFHYERIVAAHEQALSSGRSDFTDDASLAEWMGLHVALVHGSERNLKITVAEDLDLAERLLIEDAPLSDVRTGTGYDVHRFCAGDHVWLCGVKIPHAQSLEGHSDADVGLHALTDAILGAIGDGDIGDHFPPNDPQWRGAASHIFLRHAADRVAALGGMIGNVDATLLCEAPKIAPHRAAMRNAIASVLGIDESRVSVKATTTEGLGFTGRREGIAAIASATVLLPARKKCSA